MDDFSLSGDEMRSLLKDLKFVNKYLGGNSVTINGIGNLMNEHAVSGKIRIIDIGCGDGELIRNCADWCSKNSIPAEFVGLDANANIIEEAIASSEHYGNIEFVHADVFEYDFQKINYDIATCTLFLHHFDNERVERILKKVSNHAKVGIVVNDLHRSRLAFVLFRFVSILLLRTKIARIDGLISIARGFKRSDFKRFSSNLRHKTTLKWKWAYPALWIAFITIPVVLLVYFKRKKWL